MCLLVCLLLVQVGWSGRVASHGAPGLPCHGAPLEGWAGRVRVDTTHGRSRPLLPLLLMELLLLLLMVMLLKLVLLMLLMLLLLQHLLLVLHCNGRRERDPKLAVEVLLLMRML